MLLSTKRAWYETHDGEHEEGVGRFLKELSWAKGKNKVRLFKTPVAKGTALRPWASFRERKLQKLVYRLSEILRLEKLERRHMPEQGWGSFVEFRNFGSQGVGV